MVTLPLVLLAIPSVLIGFATMAPMLVGDFFKDAITVDAARHPAMVAVAEHAGHAVGMALHAFATLPFWLALAGVAVSWFFYMKAPHIPAAIQSRVGPLYRLLENKYYMDWINENIIARASRALGTGLWKVGDRALIDGLLVNGSWRVIGKIAGLVRWFQSGFVYHYALVMILGVLVLMTSFVWLGH